MKSRVANSEGSGAIQGQPRTTREGEEGRRKTARTNFPKGVVKRTQKKRNLSRTSDRKGKGTSEDEMLFHCKVCQQERHQEGGGDGQQPMSFGSVDELEAHLASEHFNCLPYECEQCQFAKFPTEFAVMKHNEQDHGNRNYSFRCRMTPDIKLKRRQVRLHLLTVTADIPTGGGKQLAPIRAHQPQQTNAPGGGGAGHLQQMGQQKKERGLTLKSEMPELMAEIQQNGSSQNNGGRPKKDSAGTEGKGIAEITGANKSKNDEEHDEVALLGGVQGSLTEQIQAACVQNIRGGGGSFGGTLEIREGAELPASLLMGNGGGDEAETDGENMIKQEADVQEILRAAAAAASQVSSGNGGGGGGGRRSTGGGSNANSTPVHSNSNRFAAYDIAQQRSWKRPQRQAAQHFGGYYSQQFRGGAAALREKVVDRIQCRKCREMVNSTGGCLMHHVNTRHLRLPLFQCKNCNKDFFEVSNTRIHKHMRLHHNGDTSNLVSNYAKYSAALHSARDECFGTREERLNAVRKERGGAIVSPPSIPPKGAAAPGNSSPSAACATVHAVFHARDGEQPQQQQNETMETTADNPMEETQQMSQDSTGFESEGGDEIGDLLGDEAVLCVGADHEEGERMGEKDGEEEQQQDMEEDGGMGAQADALAAQTSTSSSAGGGGNVSDFRAEDQQPHFLAADRASRPSFSGSGGVGPYHAHQNNHQFNQQQMQDGPPFWQHASGGYPQAMVGGMNSGGGYGQTFSPHAYQQQMMPVAPANQMGSEEKVACRLCGELVWNKMTNRLNHVNVRHLQLPLHECAICRKSFTSYSRSACYSHVQFAHKNFIEAGMLSANIEEHIIYKKERYSAQLNEAASDYFLIGSANGRGRI